MKHHSKIFISCALILSFFLTGCSGVKSSPADAKKKTAIGVVVATFDDTWRTSVRNQLYDMAENKADVDIWSGEDSQKVEDKKIDTLISKKVDVLVVNLVDKSAASDIIKKAQKADIPVIFFNIEPSEEDLKLWNKVYYVGAKGEQSGEMQGKIFADYFKNHPTKDGIIHYVMLKGPAEHQDAISRTKYSVEAMGDAGLKTEKLADAVADWDRGKAQEEMKNILALYGDNIDCVIANNDDMALGAIDSLKDSGYFAGGKYIPVVGVDGTSTAAAAIKNGTMLGTVLNDAVNQGKAIFDLAMVIGCGKTPDKDNFSFTISDNKYIWVDYKKITKENADEIK